MIITWFCLICLSLHITDTRTGDPVKRFYGVPGGNIEISVYFPSSGQWKIFCRENCEEVLVETYGLRAEKGKYSIKYEGGVLYVSISALTWSDSGRYRCGLETFSSTYLYQDFDLVVAEALLDGNKVPDLHKEAGSSLTVACYFGSSGRKWQFCRGGCGKDEVLVETDGVGAERGKYSIEYEERQSSRVVYVTIAQLTWSDSGRYGCGLKTSSSRYSYRYFDLVVAEALLDGNKVPDLHKEAGSSLTVACYFGSSGRKWQFCRGGCGKYEVLVETDGVTAERGKYNIKYERGVLYVSISALTRSDSGQYRCNLDVERWRDEYRDFHLTVTDEVKPTTTTTTTTTSRKTTTTTRSFSSSASSFTSSGSSAATDRSALSDGHESSPDVLLIVGLALAFIIIMLTVALLVFCRNRSQKHEKDPAEKTKKSPAVETNRDYEEIRGAEMESVPVEICTVYSYASYSKPAATAADDVYSLATAALPLDEAEDDLTRSTYAQVNFPNRSSAYPQRPSDDVVYSVPRVAVGSHVGEESLYSNTA